MPNGRRHDDGRGDRAGQGPADRLWANRYSNGRDRPARRHLHPAILFADAGARPRHGRLHPHAGAAERCGDRPADWTAFGQDALAMGPTPPVDPCGRPDHDGLRHHALCAVGCRVGQLSASLDLRDLSGLHPHHHSLRRMGRGACHRISRAQPHHRQPRNLPAGGAADRDHAADRRRLHGGRAGRGGLKGGYGAAGLVHRAASAGMHLRAVPLRAGTADA